MAKNNKLINMMILIVCFVLSIVTIVNADSIGYGDFIDVEYVKNYDGDTITVNIKDVHPLIGSLISIRINGIDTPEMKSDCPNEKILAYNAKVLIEKFLKNGKVITLKNVNRDKYFRILADVYVDGINIANVLIKNKMAVPYNGGTKIDWCNE